MFFWNAMGNLLEFELEGQRTRQRYICVQHVCHYAAFRPLGAAAAADGDQEFRDAPLDMHIAFQNPFKTALLTSQLKTCVLII